ASYKLSDVAMLKKEKWTRRRLQRQSRFCSRAHVLSFMAAASSHLTSPPRSKRQSTTSSGWFNCELFGFVAVMQFSDWFGL
ncbi:hypothetical protein A2U01_0005248, partial [Trifolium medium]|nr:hypothetical protein [Trifolium medium]